MAYALTKHGGLGFAERLALHLAHRGICVCCICPSAVNTGMLGRNEDDGAPRVGESFARKAGDYDRWLEGTNRRPRTMRGEVG